MAKAMLTLEQLAERLRDAPPPTPDDVPVTLDGRRIDTREKALAWIAEMNEARATVKPALLKLLTNWWVPMNS